MSLSPWESWHGPVKTFATLHDKEYPNQTAVYHFHKIVNDNTKQTW